MIKAKKTFDSSSGVDRFVLRLQIRSTSWTNQLPNTDMTTSKFCRFFWNKFFRASESDEKNLSKPIEKLLKGIFVEYGLK